METWKTVIIVSAVLLSAVLLIIGIPYVIVTIIDRNSKQKNHVNKDTKIN